MNWIAIGKGAVALVASAGVGTVVGNIVKATTPANVNTATRVMTLVGGFVLSSMVGSAAAAYVAGELDGLFPEKTKKDEPKTV